MKQDETPEKKSHEMEIIVYSNGHKYAQPSNHKGTNKEKRNKKELCKQPENN